MKRFTPFVLACLLLAISCQKSDKPYAENSNPEFSTLHQSAKNVDPGFEPLQRCAAHEVLQRQIAANPERGRRLEALERIIQEKSNSGQGGSKGKPPGSGGGSTEPPRGTARIPVVVHIVVPSNVSISDQQINSQMNVLNADFNKANSELTSGVYLAGNDPSIVANCDIQFDLQQVIRKTSNGTFGTNDAVKFNNSGGSNAVNATTALNVWVCDLSGGLLGYAQFPGGNASTDGVVIDYQAFGINNGNYSVFNKGRTATHEIGHWLNLRHIWGDSRCGNDYVDDTPSHEGPNYGCPGTSDRSFCKGRGSYDMWMNYMDYTDDACMYMFSIGQKQRIDITLANARLGYYTTSSAKMLVRN